MPEVRCSLTNLGSKRLMDAKARNSQAGMSACDTMDDEHKFKLQFVDKSDNGIVKTILIRTNGIPHSLLDGAVKPLAFEGMPLDPHRTEVQSRWWDVVYIEAAEETAIVLLRNRFTHMFLAEDETLHAPVTIDLDHNLKLDEIPKTAQWEIRIAGREMSAVETAAFVITAPLNAALDVATEGVKVTGAVVGTAVSTAATAGTAVATLGGALTGTVAVAAGAVIKGAEDATTHLVDSLRNIGSSIFTH